MTEIMSEERLKKWIETQKSFEKQYEIFKKRSGEKK